MKEKIKRILLFSLLFSALFLSALNLAEARQGCCSHHSGVCGCGCCDGTSLSATCAPYYPQCSKSAEQYVPSAQPKYTQPTQTEDDSIKNEVENAKADYYKNPSWFREKLIAKIMDSLKVNISKAALCVYTMLPDVK